MSDTEVSTVDNPSSPLGDTRPEIDPDLLSSARTLPAKTPLEGSRISLEDLFSRSFILKEKYMDRLRGHETLTLNGVELVRIQDHSTRKNSMDTVFVFRIFPESLISTIKGESAHSNEHVRKEDLRSLSLFEAIKVTWEDSSAATRRSVPDSSLLRPGMQTTATLKYKQVDGEDRLIVPGFMPTLSEQQIDDHYVRLDDEAMRLLRDGKVLRVEGAELADQQSWTGSDGNRELAFIFRMMPDETRQLLLPTYREGGPIPWGEEGVSFRPLNAVFLISESRCPSSLHDLQRGQKVKATIEHTEISGTSRIAVRNAEALQKSQSSESSSDPTGSERDEANSTPPRPRPSTNPGTSSPQYNDEWYEIDGHHIHRDQL